MADDDLNRLNVIYETIRHIRDQKGDDRCWKDYEALFQLLPEGYTAPERDTEVELDNCRDYIRACRSPGTVYISPQRRIEELTAERDALAKAIANAAIFMGITVPQDLTGPQLLHLCECISGQGREPDPDSPIKFVDRFVAMQNALDEVQGTYHKLQVAIARRHLNEDRDLSPLRNAHRVARVEALSLYNVPLTRWQEQEHALLEAQKALAAVRAAVADIELLSKEDQDEGVQ